MTNLINVNDLNDSISRPIDYWITCCSFEARCLTPLEYISPNKVSHVLSFYAAEFSTQTKENRTKFSSHYADNVTFSKFEHSLPTSLADALVNFFNSEEKMQGKSVYIDISTFPRESLLIILKFFHIYRENFHKINFVYRAANAENNLSKVIVDIRSILGFMGDNDPNKPLHLIVLSGFEFERAKNIIDSLEPNVISIGYGSISESTSKVSHQRNCDFTKKLRAYYSDENIQVFDHSLVNPENTKIKILNIVNEYSEYNTTIVPLNNKLSTLGAGLAALEQPSTQLFYSQMAEYNIKYSTPLDDFYVYNFWNSPI